MKNNITRFILLLLAFTSIVSCSDDFLNDPAPTDQVSPNVVFTSRAGADAFVSGIMRNFRSQFTNNDSAGLNSIYYARTVKGNDIIQRNTWFGFDYDNDNREPTYRRTTFSWNYPYYMINQANNLINGAEASESLTNVDKKEIVSQGKAIRAFFYFQLALEFQHTYTYDNTLPAPPIYLNLSTEGKPMSTLQEMYDLIIDDLTYATQNLTSARLAKSYINQNVAYGILARVYQTTHNWPGVEDAARKAYGGGTPSSVLANDYDNGFNDISSSEWIWGSAQSTDQSNYYWGAPHSHADHYVLSYAGTFINNDFVAQFSASDIRNLFVRAYGVPSTDYRNYITTKFTFNFDSDHPIIRTPEMLLAEAEAKYHNGDSSGAHDILFAIQSNRDPLAVKSSNTGQALLDEILLERRKELYAEIGVEWFDAKRYRKGIPRTGNHRTMGAADLQPDDKRFFLKVPQSEIDANEYIDESVNKDR
ncbi:RagB/SusD family nutrient uptake outer membrane protein [Tenacibaculum singaporense]|uniref:RagB/SusD family nutrient uptake outer membrane protein n=1 Tax=Tenacibaculum singaporense TaxID=2358479 RepID=UPI000F66630B|nr:RagB/SusD family nutrient uptake outer membrane protein [Tenacibaculum singaporense]RSC96123.1 RagB/SusD family nutrient uptake outer membrane protein [Tenacibaculum singaporense]